MTAIPKVRHVLSPEELARMQPDSSAAPTAVPASVSMEDAPDTERLRQAWMEDKLRRLAATIRRRRVACKISQLDMATKHLGVSRQTYMQFERTGKGSTELLLGAMRAVGLAGSWLALLDTDPRLADQPTRIRLTKAPKS